MSPRLYMRPAATIFFRFGTCLLIITLASLCIKAQSIKRQQLFSTDSLLHCTLQTDFKKLQEDKNDSIYQPASISLGTGNQLVKDELGIKARGVQRRAICETPPLMLDFKKPGNGPLKKLGKLKLVNACSKNWQDEQQVLKEYLVYKMYNLLTPKSFLVRLAKVQYINSPAGGSYEQYAFFIEDTDDMAARNNCKEHNTPMLTEQTNRRQMTLLAIFQYMIGNTDWAVPVLKNIKLITSKNKQDSVPYAVPYDFDYSGMVNARYAAPHPEFETETVKDRVYRGFARNMAEINTVLDSLRQHKTDFYNLVKNCTGLQTAQKKEMTWYLDDFYKLADDPRKIKEIFIDHARTQ
ncbi:MAG: hypothetical protein RL172_2993 [Bacteroidota bacterium]|jgi:hypothetical protein